MTSNGGNPRGAAAFSRLGRAIVRRPLVPVVAWVVLLAVAVPFLSHLGSVTTNSTETVPSNAPSSIASAKLAELFPNTTGGSSTILLFYGENVVGPLGQGLVMNVTAALRADRALSDVASVDSVYTEYSAYLGGETVFAADAVAAAQAGSPNVTVAVNDTAGLLWGPPALFLSNWEALLANSSGPPSAVNAPAYNETAVELSGSTEGLEVLASFYSGYNFSDTGFNGTAGACAAAFPPLSAVVACADTAARVNLLPLVPHLAGTNSTVDRAVLEGLAIENSSSPSAQRTVAAAIVGAGAGLPGSWVATVWAAFPDGLPAGARGLAIADGFANNTTAATTLAHEPLPVPLAISSQFVNPAGTASLIRVSFSVDDDATNSSGGQPVYHDLGLIDGVVSSVSATSDPGGGIGYYQTGFAPLDQLTSEAVDASLTLVLPLTVGLLLGIAMLYFRSPIAPLLAFGGLGIALVMGLGGTVLLGTVVTHIDQTALTLEEVFVLGVGTDYSIFLLARYREELVRGRSPDDAIVTAVTWAGQSVATSGSTAIIVTAALAFSGVALLSEWGMVLSLAILITMMVSLTLLPALLKLVGPRLFWPMTGPRFARAAAAANARAANRSTYFYRAARASERRPGWIVGAIVLVSVPLVALALQVPVSYDFYAQLPGGHEASSGLSELDQQFGDGFAVPSYALVSFASPLVVANQTNLTEFTDLAELGVLASAASGIAVVRSPVGPYGASLSAWLSLATEPVLERTALLETLSGYVGTDGRTVLFSLQTNATGLSAGAVAAVDRVQSAFTGYADGHPEITGTWFGGGAPVISDLAAETSLATEVMLASVTVGLILVLLVVLRSWIVAVMAVATVGLSISWAWAISDVVVQQLFNVPLFFYVRTILIFLVLGLGIDYNIFLLTRIREERLLGRSARDATVEAVGRTGGIITAAAVILGCAFAALLVGEFTLIRAIGFAVAVAVMLDAMVVRTYFVPGALQLLGEKVRMVRLGRSGPSVAPPLDPGAIPAREAPVGPR